MNYPLNHFSSYARLVIDEMINRGFNLNKQKIEYVYEFCGSPNILFDEIFSDWHNEEYIKICFYNIYEKYICAGITEEEWNKIMNKFEYILK